MVALRAPRCDECGGPLTELERQMVCLGCGWGCDPAAWGRQVLREVLAIAADWLAAAGPLVTELGKTPLDPRYPRAVEVLRQRQATYRQLEERLARLEEERARDRLRFRFMARWGREKGVLEIRDCFSGEWLQVEAREAPRSWVRTAMNAKERQRAARGAGA